jgi:hypothetical protein
VKLARWWVYSVFIALDQLLNAVTFGYPDETVSFRAATARDAGKPWGCVLCRVLDWIDPRHCDGALKGKKMSLIKRGLGR